MLAWARERPLVAVATATAALLAIALAGLLRPVIALGIVGAAVVVLRGAGRQAATVNPLRPAAATVPAPARPARVPVAAAAVLLAFGVVGAGALAMGVRTAYEQEAALLGAQRVPATVVSVAMVEPRARQRGGFSVRPAVRHRYTFAGRSFESDRLYPLGEHLDARDAAALLAMYRPGQRVFTHVPGHDPAAAYLAPRRRWSVYGLVPMGLAFMLPVALAGAALRRRMTRGRCDARGGVVQR